MKCTYLSIYLLFVAVLIHHAEVTQGRPVVLAISLDKLCLQASLASMPIGESYAAESLLQGTWRPLWPCILGALGGVLETWVIQDSTKIAKKWKKVPKTLKNQRIFQFFGQWRCAVVQGSAVDAGLVLRLLRSQI